jgi:lysophospholipid acyltransferase (LPLAT)-like uncharacterized protein
LSAESEELLRPYAPSHQARRFRTTGVERGSKRRMSAGRRAWYALLVTLLRGFLALLWATCRVSVHGAAHLDPARRREAPAVIVYWHQMHVMCAWLLRRHARAGLPLAVLTSPSVSGEVPATLIRRWGMRPVRGSSTRSAGDALREMHAVLVQDRESLVMTADGPKGPRHEFKPGALLLARMARAPVVPMAYAASRAVRWRSWDEFLIPWPFSRVVLVVGEPWVPAAGFSMAQLPAAARVMEGRLQSLGAEARRLLG